MKERTIRCNKATNMVKILISKIESDGSIKGEHKLVGTLNLILNVDTKVTARLMFKIPPTPMHLITKTGDLNLDINGYLTTINLARDSNDI